MGQLQFDIMSGRQPQSSPAVPLQVIQGTNFPFAAALFDPSTQQDLYLYFRMPPDYTGSPSVDIEWEAAATTGAVKLQAQLGAMAPGAAASWETKALAAAQTTTTTVSTTANGPTRTTITITNTDSAAAGNNCLLKISRLAADAADTMAGNANVFGVTLNYS